MVRPSESATLAGAQYVLTVLARVSLLLATACVASAPAHQQNLADTPAATPEAQPVSVAVPSEPSVGVEPKPSADAPDAAAPDAGAVEADAGPPRDPILDIRIRDIPDHLSNLDLMSSGYADETRETVGDVWLAVWNESVMLAGHVVTITGMVDYYHQAGAVLFTTTGADGPEPLGMHAFPFGCGSIWAGRIWLKLRGIG